MPKDITDGNPALSKALIFPPALAIETDNIAQTIVDLCKQYNLRPNQLDFSAQQTKTYAKFPGEKTEQEVTPPLIGKLSDPAILTDNEFMIRQVHLATFRMTSPASARSLLSAEIAANASRSRAVATVSTESRLTNFSSLHEFVYTELNKIKMRHGMIVGFREGTMQKDITTLCNKVRVHNKVVEPVRIMLCDWLAPKPTINDNLILHFKDKNKQAARESDRIDYADRGFVKTVDTGELLIEYVRPQTGTAGRDFRGKYVGVTQPRKQFSPIAAPDPETIEVVEDDLTIKYYARRTGYVNFRQQNNSLTIGDTIEVESVDFKSTGNIAAGLDRDVKIKIEGNDAYEDHIGANTKIEASEIDLSGSVGSSARVKANRISVAGQTHATSTIFAETAQIAVHRGMLEARNAQITRLEHGRISAEEVKIDMAIGGIVCARRIDVGVLHSHATLIASEKIEIHQLVGGENHIYIEAAAWSRDRKKLEALLIESKKLTREVASAFKKYENKRLALVRNRPQFEQLRTRIDNDKSEGKIPPTVFVDRYNEYFEEIRVARTLKDELDELTNRQNEVEGEIGAIQNAILDAQIINHDLWRNYNEIKFKHSLPPKEFFYAPPENSFARVIKIEISGAEDYAIKVKE
ncbi:MAG: FapA family protein [Helicobacteraceae bacterium]|jgi:hypothetical protein|nr:FapA family protein [Helicobacteraceae bacterium]